MSIAMKHDTSENKARTNEEMENALYHLMYQFRQINSKYGLMIGEEIKELYNQRIELILSSKGYIDMIEKKTKSSSN